ncbi:TonB-dependent receptor [Ideonella sp. DXS22W]|uniref:TonB-dependent receptor n=1 Tax=Pseudaquabacterium inlustre TaxID=2984192 RepID=A0ABU9CQ64_9BURK
MNHRLHPTAAAAMALATLLAAAAQAQAQTAAAAADTASSSEVVITGSRIRGAPAIGAPVGAVSRDDIETSGASSTAQIIQQMPQVFNLGVSESSRGQGGGAGNITYGSGINLRGIGPFATLVLVNGHRIIGQGTSAASVDPNVLPSLAIERMEVVADGASALYGSDAVAGVANLIMRRGERGGQALVRFGVADGYHERQIGVLYGHKWQGGQITLTAENTLRSQLSGRDRDFFRGDLRAQGGGDYRSTQCSPGNIVISGTSYAIPTGGVTTATAGSLVAGTSNKCDNLQIQDLLPRQERNSLAFTFNHTLTPTLALWADGFASQRDYSFNPGALSANLTVPSTNPFYVRPAGAPAGTSETVTYSFINDLPVNTNNGRSKSVQLTVGADVTLAAGWKAGAMFGIGDNRDLAVTLGGLNTAAITAALADTNPATALNVFGSGANNPATLAKIANNVAYSPGHTRFQNYQLKADGPVVELPGGTLRAAVGYEGQRLLTVGGQTTGPATNPTFGEVSLRREVDSLYAEALVPVVGERNGVPFMRSLNVSLASRTDRYSDVGSTSNPKLGVTWVPVDGVALRGSYGTSFRAPGLTQIRGFANGGRGGLYVQNYSDPTLGGALRVGVAISGNNPDLKPETAKTKTLGIDWTPKFITRTKFSLTWFDIEYDNQITGYLSDLTVLNREAQFAGTSVIQRNPSAETVAALIAKYPLASGVLPANWTLVIDGRQMNLARSQSRGVDFSANSRVSLGERGEVMLGLSGTVFTSYRVALTPGGALVDQLNTIYNPLRFKARGTAGWVRGPLQLNLAINHQNAYDNTLASPVQRVASNTTADVRAAWAFESDGPFGLLKDATVALGVTNLADRKPPFVNVAQSTNGGGGFDPTLTNPIGRIVSVSFDKRF